MNYNEIINQKIGIINKELGNADDSDNQIVVYKKFKSKISKSDICKTLLINEQMLIGFETALFTYEKHKENESLKKVAFLRLANWLNTINNVSGFGTKINIEEINSKEHTAIKQVRAIELVLRDLIYDQHDGSEGVINKLNSFFKSETVQKWIKSADETGVLSGTTFNELSALFLDKRLFEAYDNIFVQENALMYDKKKTSSLRFFLDDIRIIRNVIAHNKKISPVQIELLNEYYNEISKNIDKAFEEGKTKVTTGTYIDVSEEELNRYMSSVKEDMNEIKGGLDDLSKKVDEGFAAVIDDTNEIKEIISSKWVSKKFITLYSIIIILAIVSVFITNKYMSRNVSLKIQFSWINENISLPFEELKKITLNTKNYTKDFHLSTDGLLEINDVPKDNLNEKITLTFEDNRVIQIDTPLLKRDFILPIKLSIKDINEVSLIVRDFETGQPVKNVNISFLGLTSSADNFGKATIAIPEDKLSRYIDIEIIAEGYQYYKLNNVLVNSKKPIEVLLEKI